MKTCNGCYLHTSNKGLLIMKCEKLIPLYLLQVIWILEHANNQLEYLSNNQYIEAVVQSATLLKKRLWHRCFPVNFAKFLRAPFLQDTSGGCFWVYFNFVNSYDFLMKKLHSLTQWKRTLIRTAKWKIYITSKDEFKWCDESCAFLLFYFQYFNLEVSYLIFNAISGVLQQTVVPHNTVLDVVTFTPVRYLRFGIPDAI